MSEQMPRPITPVPTHLLLDEDLSIEARGLLSVMCAEMRSEISIESLRALCGVGRDKMADLLAELAAYGVVRLSKVRAEDGRLDGSKWTFVGGRI